VALEYRKNSAALIEVRQNGNHVCWLERIRHKRNEGLGHRTGFHMWHATVKGEEIRGISLSHAKLLLANKLEGAPKPHDFGISDATRFASILAAQGKGEG
jgi:hypothetical protein